jgi:hypothetical protein
MRFSSQDPTDAEILRAASSIRSRMRKRHGGGRPPKQHDCRWCGIECLGLHALDEHERSCDQRPSGELVPVTSDEMAALAWTLDVAAG